MCCHSGLPVDRTCRVVIYPPKVQHILQHETDPGGGLPLLYYFLHLVKVLIHTRLKTSTTVQ